MKLGCLLVKGESCQENQSQVCGYVMCHSTSEQLWGTITCPVPVLPEQRKTTFKKRCMVGDFQVKQGSWLSPLKAQEIWMTESTVSLSLHQLVCLPLHQQSYLSPLTYFSYNQQLFFYLYKRGMYTHGFTHCIFPLNFSVFWHSDICLILLNSCFLMDMPKFMQLVSFFH